MYTYQMLAKTMKNIGYLQRVGDRIDKIVCRLKIIFYLYITTLLALIFIVTQVLGQLYFWLKIFFDVCVSAVCPVLRATDSTYRELGERVNQCKSGQT
ncbi:hypothetical protein Slin_0189 [Spirosoma linguale DSM 74]|uniref:Uncharacterized protein n=1 Tax=Spirosoma linguale (strain ATCC 33905 / DSM 74 / LMG 10896 / Claus 1) TaxID=504472 RepID=D2QCE3_SPILD|nr:hypothetical protein Slin_0189 [Spirosoma linguale DSM 74]